MHNILIITTWGLTDGLVGRYVLPYIPIMKKHLSKGSNIYLVTYEKDVPENTTSEDFVWIPLKYRNFGLRAGFLFIVSFFRLWKLIREKKIHEIHPWCSPPGVMGYMLSKVTGCRLVLDSFEPHAEPMVESGTWKRSSIAFKLLFYFEKRMNKAADIIIAANPDMRGYCKHKLGFAPPKIYSKPACVNLDDFELSKKKSQFHMNELGLDSDVIVAVYAGKFGGSYLEHEIFDWMNAADKIFGSRFRFMILNGQPERYVRRLAEKVGFNYEKVIHRFVPYQEVPFYIGLGDFGIVPFKPVPSKRFGSPIKTAEYLALGLPVLITKNISHDSIIIESNHAGAVLQSFNQEEYRRTINQINSILDEGEDLAPRIRSIAKKNYSFDTAEEVYSLIYG